MNNEKTKNSNSFHIKGIFILIFLTFASSIPVAINKLNSSQTIGDILYVGHFFETLGSVLGVAIISIIITFFVNKFKFKKATFYKIFFYVMFFAIFKNITDSF